MNWKKLLAALFLVIYLLSVTETGEFLKIPTLVIHFYNHKRVNKNIGLISFFNLHYNIKEGKDQEKNSRLPFKSPPHPVISSFLSATPPAFITTSTLQGKENMPIFCDHTEIIIASQYLLAIWQPPRFC